MVQCKHFTVSLFIIEFLCHKLKRERELERERELKLELELELELALKPAPRSDSGLDVLRW